MTKFFFNIPQYVKGVESILKWSDKLCKYCRDYLCWSEVDEGYDACDFCRWWRSTLDE